MAADADLSQQLADTVRAAASAHTPLALRGGGSKRFLTGEHPGRPLDVGAHRGIVTYEPTELVITARAGTPLTAIEAALVAHNQMLGFEPPHFGDGATLGGTVACGLSGPRRPYAGAARDFVLGTKIVNGQGEILSFGGQVMKNVAGFDLSRLMVGARGTLGVLLEISLKVLPRPQSEITLAFPMPADRAIVTMNTWAGQPLPLSAACYLGDTLYVRLSGNIQGVQAARVRLGGEVLPSSPGFWDEIREHRHRFFRDEAPLWRLSVPPSTAPLDLPGTWLLDWGGAQRWLKSDAPGADIRATAESVGGYAMLFRAAGITGRDDSELPAALQLLQRNLKHALDPAGILNAASAAT